MTNKVSLNDLKTVSAAQIRPETTKQEQKELSTIDSAFSKIDNELIPRVKAEAEEERLNKEIESEINGEHFEGEPDSPYPISDKSDDEAEFLDIEEPEVLDNKDDRSKTINTEGMNVGFDANSVETLDDNDFAELEDDESDDDTKERTKELKQEIVEKIVPFKKIDSSKFVVSEKPISISNALKVTSTERLVEWMLPATDAVIVLKSFKGIDIQNLIPDRTVNRINHYRRVYNTFFNKMMNAKQYATMEQWIKTVKLLDEDHLYFAGYLSAFKDSNVMPFECTECKKVFTKEVPIEDLVVYKNDKVKKRVQDKLNSDPSFKQKNAEIDVYIEQISDDYAIGIKDPSIFNIYFENGMLDEAFANKYSNILSLATYIDSIYKIDYNTNSFIPIKPKAYPNDIVKTAKAKIILVNKIIQTLTSDQYSYVLAMINNLNMKEDDITYKMPDVVCPHCGKKIIGGPTTARDLLFTRHQLAAVGNTIES